jgi:hypothetical protein
MAQRLIRSYEAQIDDISKKARSVTARINTDVVDRYQTVIDPLGGDFANFMGSPTVLWEHGQCPTRGRLPIGSCSSIVARRADRDIIARTFFRGDDYSQRLFECYLDGTLRGWSVDFLPDARFTSPPTASEKRSRPDLATCQKMFRKWELTGYSAVSYAGNPEALTLAVERGLWVPDDVRQGLPAARTMTEGTGTAGGNTTKADKKRYVKELGDDFGVYGEGGQLLGRHKTRADADAQLNAIESTSADPARSLPPLRGRTLEDVLASVDAKSKLLARSELERAMQDARDLAWGRV